MVIYLYRYAINVTIFYQRHLRRYAEHLLKFTSCGAIFISHIGAALCFMDLMVEDSKAWFEIYEVAIAAYEENDKYLNKIENNNNEDKIGAFQFQQLESFETKLTEKIFDLPILNVQGGTYPSSKINCVIGQVMLSVWGTITFCHI